MRAHVTGARGFIARHLLAELESRGHVVSSSDVEEAFAPELVLAHEPDVVIHAGAIVGRELRGLGRERTVSLNASSTAILANACRGLELPLVYLSTSEVYGPRVDGTLAFEDDELVELPHNLYGLTKRWGEEACRLEYRERPELLTLARLSMPYGPGHFPGSGRAALTNFLWAAMRGDPLVVHRGARRSWCWIGDTVRALAILSELAAGRREAGWLAEPLVVNVGRDDNERAMLEVAELALATVVDDVGETGAAIALVDPPAGYTLVKRLDVSRMRELGWIPVVELEEGVGYTYRWLRETAPLIQV